MKNDDSEKVGRLEAAPRKKGIYKTKVCQRCEKEYPPTNNFQKWCAECRPEVEREQQKNWNVAHPLYHQEWRGANSGRVRANQKSFRLVNPEYQKEAYWTDPERARARVRAWYAAHPGANKVWVAAHPEKVSLTGKKNKAKRRSMGWNPLNTPFKGSDGHHINENDVIYIPKTLHQSVWHNHWTGQGMEQINVLALDWLAKETQYGTP